MLRAEGRHACVHVQLLVTLWIAAQQTPLSLRFSKQEYWNGLHFPSLGDFPDPGIKPMSPMSPALQVDSLPTEPSGIFCEVLGNVPVLSELTV